MRYTISLDLDEVSATSEMSTEDMVKFLALSMQKATVDHGILATRIDVRTSKTSVARPTGSSTGRPGRKPVNRPKIEAWIRKHIPVGESTQGTTGLNGVDRKGRPLVDAPNRIYPHRLAAPEPEGVGLSLLAIDKVLKELVVEGFLERGFASGSPFYEYVKELPPEGWEPGKSEIKRATIHEIDFSNVED